MVGLQVPFGSMTTVKYATPSSPSMYNRTSRAGAANSRMQLKIRNGSYHGRIQVEVGGGRLKSLRMAAKKLQSCKLQSYGFLDLGQPARSRSGLRLNGDRDRSACQVNRHSKYSIRAGMSSTEAS